jgi:hypothetical protein
LKDLVRQEWLDLMVVQLVQEQERHGQFACRFYEIQSTNTGSNSFPNAFSAYENTNSKSEVETESKHITKVTRNVPCI